MTDLHDDSDLTTPSPGDRRWSAVAVATAAPDFITPWLDRFYDYDDADLIRLTCERPGALGTHPGGAAERAVRRAVLDTAGPSAAGAHQYRVASFHARFDVWACFEGWHDLPADVRRELNEWELADYIDGLRRDLSVVREGTLTTGGEADYAYLLLEEAEALVREAGCIYLWPCNCRSMWGNCSLPVQVCLRFSDDSGLGKVLGAEEAVRVLRTADAAGLTRTAYADRSAADAGAICCCCTDCCFPHLAAARLHVDDVWPRRRHLAVIDKDACIACDVCVERCPFGAIASGDDRPSVDARLCRGCGVCATGCASEAIAMAPRTAGAILPPQA